MLIHSLDFLSPFLKKEKASIKVDNLVIDYESATIFIIKSKKFLTKNTAKKVYDHLRIIRIFFNLWFGPHICDAWNFEAIIYCESFGAYMELLCDNCLHPKIAQDHESFIQIMEHHRKSTMIDVACKPRLVQDFLLMARLLIFGFSANRLATPRRFAGLAAKYMEEVGSWYSFLLWSFLVPGPEQMEIMSKQRVVFHSGWGSGKTTTGIEACKRWSGNANKMSKPIDVLVLINGLNTYGRELLLLHRLRQTLKEFSTIKVEQIDLVNDSIQHLEELTKGHTRLFIDEMPGDQKTLESPEFKKKMKVMAHGKEYVWIAISNYDNDNAGDVHSNLEDVYCGFKIVTSLNKNLRNPLHVKELVARSYKKISESGNVSWNQTIADLNKKLESPPLLLDIQDSPYNVLSTVFNDKNLRTAIVARNSENAEQILSFLRKSLGHKSVIPWTRLNSPSIEELNDWINKKCHTMPILVTAKKFMNGFDAEVIISADDVPDDELLGDVASRATCQFIRYQDLIAFLKESFGVVLHTHMTINLW